jgi:hypothetical protein
VVTVVTNTEKPKSKYYWMPDAMPKVAAEVAKRRALHGKEFVNDCFKRGMNGEVGFFYAFEGVIAIGTPDPKLRAIDRVYEVLAAGLPVDWMIEMPTPELLTGESNVKNN